MTPAEAGASLRFRAFGDLMSGRLGHEHRALPGGGRSAASIVVPVQRCAVYPPSMVNVWPVTNAASSDRR